MPAPALYDRINELAPDFGGLFLQPHDDGYEAARRVHNGLVDKRPALIARCSGVADVIAKLDLWRLKASIPDARGEGLASSAQVALLHADPQMNW